MKETKTPNVDTAIILKSLEKKAKPLATSLQSFKIKTSKDYIQKSEQVKLLKQLKKEAESKLSEIVDPIKDSVKRIQQLFKPFIESVNLLEIEAKKEMLDFNQKQIGKQEKLDMKFEEKGLKISTYVKHSEALTEHRQGPASIRTMKVLQIFDRSAIPAEFLVPDEKTIKIALLSGLEVPGCKIVEEPIIAI